jgi:hypothetical protein
MTFLTRRRLLIFSLILAGAGIGWFLLRPDPREAFLKDVDSLLELAHTRRHSQAAEWFSPEAAAYFQDATGFTLPQLLALVRRYDDQENRSYRVGSLDVFHARDYAEIRIQRSEPGGTFSGQGWFSVPFLYQNGDWKIAAGFRGGQSWDYPEK